MSENRVKRASSNIIWSGMQRMASVLVGFVARTCLIHILGVQYVGLDGLFTSILSVLNLTELGIGSAMVFSMYKPIAEGDDERVCALLALYRKCYRVIGIVILTGGLCIMPFVRSLISGDIPEGINIYILFAIYLANTVVSYFLFAYKSSLLNACQRVDIINIINMLVTVLKTMIQCAALLLTKDYYYYVWIIPLSTIAQNLITSVLVSKKYPQYVCKGKVEKETIAGIRKRVYGLICQKIGDVVLNAVDNIVISVFQGLTVLGIYNNYMFINNGLTRMLFVFRGAVTPVVGNSVAVETKEKNYRNFNHLQLLYFWLGSWAAICQLCLMQPFIGLWAGKKWLVDTVTAVMFVLYFYLDSGRYMVMMYNTAAGIWWEGRYVPLISSVVNLTINLILVRFIGLKGILLSTIIALVFIDIPFRCRVLFKYYFDFANAWKTYIGKQVINFVFMTVVGAITYKVCMIFSGYTILTLLGRGCICIVLPNILLFLGYRKSKDFDGAMDMLKKVLRRRK